MALYPINPDTGNPTFLARAPLPSVEVVRYRLTPDLPGMGGFALQYLAATIYGDWRYWRGLAESSRLVHPADFDIGSDVNFSV